MTHTYQQTDGQCLVQVPVSLLPVVLANDKDDLGLGSK